MKTLTTILLSLSALPLLGAPNKSVTFKEKIERPVTSQKEHYGEWLDKEGFVTPGPKIKNWIDQDRDKVDDRYQAGPGQPAGKQRPEDIKPKPKPEVKPELKPTIPKFPKHWGRPPAQQTRDLVTLPGKFGKGSSTLAKWIEKNLREDGDWHKKPPAPKKPHQPNEGSKKENDSKPKVEKPRRPTRPTIPDELKDKLDSYKKEKEALNKDLKGAVDELRKLHGDKTKLSRGTIKKAIADFHKANKERLEAQKELGQDIKEGLEANRPERPSKPEVSPKIKELRDNSGNIIKKLHDSKKQFIHKLKDADRETHKEILDSFREEQSSLMNELKGIQQQIREQMDHSRNAADLNQAVEKRRPPRKPEGKNEARRPTDR